MASAMEEKVLVVSGDPTVISPIQDFLRDDYPLLLARNGMDALRLFHAQHPLLVIIDMDIPALDGVALMRQLGIRGDDLCSVIILRSDSCGSEIGECFDLGLTAFLKKPFNFYEIKSLVRQAIDSRRIFLDLKREKEYARNLIDSALDMIIAVDEFRRIKEFNRAAEETFGYAAEEVRGQPVVILYSDPEEGNRVSQGLQEHGHYTGEITCRRKNGELFPTSLSAALLRDSKGRIIGSIGSSRDITEQKKIEEIKRARVAAEIANKSKSSFLATMSHEIRSPMNAIIGMTELALNSNLDGEQRQYLQIVQQSADALLCLLNDVLDLSKIEVGRLELERLPFSLAEVVEQTCDTMAVQAQNKNLELIWSIEPDVPMHLEGDPMRVRQILVNLIGNAIKFTRQGEVTLTLRAALESLPMDPVAEGKPTFAIHFSVRDTGIGIPEEKQDAVFEQFTQAGNSIQRQYGGTGLGLSISRQLTQLMGGRMWLESSTDQGSCFHFIIPFTVRATLLKLPPPTHELAVFGLSILVVAPNDALRDFLCRTLRLWGYRVQGAKNGEEMLQTLGSDESGPSPCFDLLILDCQLPDLMWINLIQWMEENTHWVGRVLKIVPNSSRHRKQAGCLEVKASASLSKPMSPQSLIRALNTAFGVAPQNAGVDAIHTIRRTEHPLKILLVDDDPGNLLTTGEILRKAGHAVHPVRDGRESLAALERDNFDLVLMDLQMPELDGLEATRIIRSGSLPAIRPDVPIMGITAYALKGDRERCLEAGMDEYLAKPFKVDDLLELTEQFAQRVGVQNRVDKGVVLQEEPLVPPVEAADTALHQRRLLFLEHGVQLRDTLRFALHGRDPSLAENCAQQIKEAAARIGAVRIKSAAFRVVMAVRKEDFDRAETHMELLRQEFQTVDALLRTTPAP